MFDIISKFEQTIADYYGAPYGVSVDSCTHAIELCLRLTNANNVTCPSRTYISVPFTFNKLGLNWSFTYQEWYDYYFIGNTNIIDGAVLWKENSYQPTTLLCLSFQFKKHLSLGRGGMILLDNKDQYDQLIKMSYDGRSRDCHWGDQNITTMGYHYYMTPETAQLGLEKFETCKNTVSKKFGFEDYPFLPKMEVFNANH